MQDKSVVLDSTGVADPVTTSVKEECRHVCIPDTVDGGGRLGGGGLGVRGGSGGISCEYLRWGCM